MSRAELNMALLDIDRDDESLSAFDADPAGFLEGRRLSHDERAALEAWDHGALYALGAHPFILWQVVRSLSALRGEELADLIERFRAAVEPHGYPGFGTWSIRTRKARKIRNPQTNEIMKLKATKTIGFRPAKELKATL